MRRREWFFFLFVAMGSFYAYAFEDQPALGSLTAEDQKKLSAFVQPAQPSKERTEEWAKWVQKLPRYVDIRKQPAHKKQREDVEKLMRPFLDITFADCDGRAVRFVPSKSELDVAQFELERRTYESSYDGYSSRGNTVHPFRPLLTRGNLIVLDLPLTREQRADHPKARRILLVELSRARGYGRVQTREIFHDGERLHLGERELLEESPLQNCRREKSESPQAKFQAPPPAFKSVTVKGRTPDQVMSGKGAFGKAMTVLEKQLPLMVVRTKESPVEIDSRHAVLRIMKESEDSVRAKADGRYARAKSQLAAVEKFREVALNDLNQVQRDRVRLAETAIWNLANAKSATARAEAIQKKMKDLGDDVDNLRDDELAKDYKKADARWLGIGTEKAKIEALERYRIRVLRRFGELKKQGDQEVELVTRYVRVGTDATKEHNIKVAEENRRMRDLSKVMREMVTLQRESLAEVKTIYERTRDARSLERQMADLDTLRRKNFAGAAAQLKEIDTGYGDIPVLLPMTTSQRDAYLDQGASQAWWLSFRRRHDHVETSRYVIVLYPRPKSEIVIHEIWKEKNSSSDPTEVEILLFKAGSPRTTTRISLKEFLVRVTQAYAYLEHIKLDSKMLSKTKTFGPYVGLLKREGLMPKNIADVDAQINYVPSLASQLPKQMLAAMLPREHVEKMFQWEIPGAISRQIIEDELGKNIILSLYAISTLDSHYPDVLVHEAFHSLDMNVLKLSSARNSGGGWTSPKREFERDFPAILEQERRTDAYRAGLQAFLKQRPEDEAELSRFSADEQRRRLVIAYETRHFGKDAESLRERIFPTWEYLRKPEERLAFAAQIAFLRDVEKLELRDVFTRLKKLAGGNTESQMSVYEQAYYRDLYSRRLIEVIRETQRTLP